MCKKKYNARYKIKCLNLIFSILEPGQLRPERGLLRLDFVPLLGRRRRVDQHEVVQRGQARLQRAHVQERVQLDLHELDSYSGWSVTMVEMVVITVLFVHTFFVVNQSCFYVHVFCTPG